MHTRCAALIVASSFLAAAQSTPEGLLIGPVSYTIPVEGVQVAAQASSYLSINTTQRAINVGLNATINLADLQRQFPALIETIPLPRDNCKSYSFNNPVVSLSGRELAYSAGQAVMNLTGSVAIWSCLEFFGGPIKNKVLTQPFEATVPLSVAPTSATTVGATIGTPTIKLTGKYAFIAGGILHIAGVNINDYAKKAIDQAVSPSALQLGIPKEYAALNPTITAAKFVDSDGALGLNVVMNAQVTQGSANDFVKMLMQSLAK